MITWLNADALQQGKMRNYEQLAELTGDDDVQHGEVGVQVDYRGAVPDSIDSLIIYGISLPALAGGLEQLARSVRGVAARRVHEAPTDNPRLARILKMNRAHEALVAVLREHFSTDELGTMFDLLSDKEGQPFETLVGAVGTAWAEPMRHYGVPDLSGGCGCAGKGTPGGGRTGSVGAGYR